MSLRTDIWVEWSVSPRIIWVTAPSIEITIQDLVDTIRVLEAEQENMVYPPLLSASGKDPLGGGVSVGITAALQNAVLAFEARPGPAFVQCSVSGGNLVSFDLSGFVMSSIYPTAYTQILLTSSSSATLQELSAIQFSSFENCVTINVTSPYSGTDFPVGTPATPVNNLVDAQAIAAARGFEIIRVVGDLTVGATESLSGYKVHGGGASINAPRTTITLTAGCTTSNTFFYDAKIQGVQGGETIYVNCVIGNITNTHCQFDHCALIGPTQLYYSVAGWLLNHTTDLQDCHTSYTQFVVDYNNSPMNQVYSNFTGKIKFTNITNADTVVVIRAAGAEITLDSTCTSGRIEIYGSAEIIDNSTGIVIERDGLTSMYTQTAAVPVAVWNVLTTGNSNASTFGGTVGTGGVDPAVITAAVWDASLSAHNTSGTFGNTNQVSGGSSSLTAAQVRAEIDANSTQLQSIAANTATIMGYTDTVESTLSSINSNISNLPTAPTVTQIRTEIDTNSTQLISIAANTANIRSTVTTLNSNVSTLPTAPTVTQIRQEIDTNSTQLQSIAANTSIISGKQDTLLSSILGTAANVWGYVTRTLTSASGPSAAEIRQEIDANSTQLISIAANTANIRSTVTTLNSNVSTLPNAPTVTQIRQEIDTNSTQLQSIAANTSTISTNVINVPVTTWGVKTAGNTAVGTFGAALAAASSGGVDPSVIAGAVWAANTVDYNAAGTMGNVMNQTNVLTPEQTTMMLEMYRLMGLDPTKPLVVTQTARTAGTITQTIDSTPTTTTVTRI